MATTASVPSAPGSCPAPAADRATVVGLMSGTSHDAIDAAAARLRADGDTLCMEVLGMVSVPYPPRLRRMIRDALPPAKVTMAQVCALDTLIGQAFAEVARRAVGELCQGEADLVVSHGQTLHHWVEDGAVLGTLQLGQPAWIAEATGCPVVADLRPRDVAAGGQGAPLVSLVDALWLGDARRAAVNLGGIANATLVGPEREPVAFDTGPANALIDALVLERTGGAQAFDRDGRMASLGTVDEALLSRMLAEPYYALPPPRTTGKELFDAGYTARFLAGQPRRGTADLVATLTALTARTVADAVRGEADEIVVSGGGTRNPVMMRMLREQLAGTPVRTSDELGIPSGAKEALAFAVLGLLTANGMPGTAPSATGARHASVLGALLPGASPVPRILDRPPTRLRVVPREG